MAIRTSAKRNVVSEHPLTPRIPECTHILACSVLRPLDGMLPQLHATILAGISSISRCAEMRLEAVDICLCLLLAEYMLWGLCDQVPYAAGTFLDTDGRSFMVSCLCAKWGATVVPCAGSWNFIFDIFWRDVDVLIEEASLEHHDFYLESANPATVIDYRQDEVRTNPADNRPRNIVIACS